MALTDADAAGRRQVIAWMEQAGLTVRIDRMGNVYGRREGTDPTAAPVLTGSHIDSVATAGAFDGCLGVLCGIEVARTLDERHGPADVRLEPPYAYVECHIEQGPVLAENDVQVGVVTGVQGISWQEITIHGRAAHAGTTPTHLRADAGLAAARIGVHLRSIVDSGAYGELRATVGHLAVHPGLTNIVPARAELTVDLRNPDDARMARAEEDLAAFLRTLEDGTPGLTLTTRRMAKTAYVPYGDGLRTW
ncbi:peptidase dimerization domain-containing protein [Streptomyces iranensis]|uniref:Allantoate amidohydrolase n=1 Tax=Streptomyces iranensis TaxID=576784 RepID=A0A061A3K8_9ACTN|nr:peptidase dimerization domain-containing protein [Streptomyces iranensis]MBP2064287.1 N-carbamoyl-L-amino-acid hydrolase [Streptomyces iranensis]CDR17420.1 allantoate amidohydrolase [Streptomyces iranensis]